MRRTVMLFMLAAALLLTGCGGNTYCTDEGVTSQLKNDGYTPEFVLDGEYFVLPVPLAEFTRRGWEMDLFEVGQGLRPEIVEMRPGTYAWVKLQKDGRELNTIAVNDTGTATTLAGDCVVIEVRGWKMDGLEESLVLSHGITVNTSCRDVRSALKDREGYAEDRTIALLAENGAGDEYQWLEAKPDGSELSYITVASGDRMDYTEYEAPGHLEEELRRFREEYRSWAEADMETYGGKYAALVEDLQKGTITDMDTIYYSFTGTVDEIVYTKPLVLSGTWTEGEKTYLLTGGDGNRYAVQALDLALEAGEEVELWGSMRNDGSSLLRLEDGSLIPVLCPCIAEQLGEEIYLNRG